jgi:hypothetical protein
MRPLALLLPVLLAVASATPGAQRPAQGPSLDRYDQAFSLFNKEGDHEGALRLLNTDIEEWRQHSDHALYRPHLTKAFELRGQVRIQLGDRAGAADDFTALFRLNPEYIPPAMAKQAATLRVTVQPADSDVIVAGERMTSGIDRRLVAGSHRLTARRLGYRTDERQIAVAGGSIQAVDLTLERDSAVLKVTTVPATADVYIDGVLRGTAQPQEVPGAPADGTGIARFDGLKPGDYRIEVRSPCYATKRATLKITTLEDVELEPIELADAKGTLQVQANVSDAEVLVQNQRGKAPFQVQLCEGEYTVDVRAPAGRIVSRQKVAASTPTAYTAEVRPTFALLPMSGALAPPAADLEGIATSLRGLTTAAFLLPQGPAAAVTSDDVAPLAQEQRTAGPSAQSRRVQRTAELANRLAVQGVAVVSRASPTEGRYRIDLFARGSAEPDAIVWIDDRDQIRETRHTLDEPVRLFRRSLGVSLADVVGYAGPVVVRASADGTFAVGDVLLTVDGTPVDGVAAVNKLLEARQGAADAAVTLQSRHGESKSFAAPVQRRAILHWMGDETRLFNKLALDYAYVAATSPHAEERTVARINQAIAYMRLKNLDAARGILQAVSTEQVEGLAAGAVPFLLAECLFELNEEAEARKHWQAAMEAGGALTEDGPDIAQRAKEKLAALSRR